MVISLSILMNLKALSKVDDLIIIFWIITVEQSEEILKKV